MKKRCSDEFKIFIFVHVHHTASSYDRRKKKTTNDATYFFICLNVKLILGSLHRVRLGTPCLVNFWVSSVMMIISPSCNGHVNVVLLNSFLVSSSKTPSLISPTRTNKQTNKRTFGQFEAKISGCAQAQRSDDTVGFQISFVVRMITDVIVAVRIIIDQHVIESNLFSLIFVINRMFFHDG